MTAEGVWLASFGRTAVPANGPWIRSMLPTGVIGAYVLLQGDVPFYLGRSDSCLAGRLLRHEYLSEASHVYWEVCRNPVRAYHCEAFWYDRAGISHNLRNRVHPARPIGHPDPCPFCSIDTGRLRSLMANLSRKKFKRV